MDKNKLPGRLKAAAVLLLIAAAAIGCLGCNAWDDGRISVGQYYTGEQIEEVFSSNEERFTEIAKIVQDCEAFNDRMKEEGDGDARLISKTDSQYFTEEQWRKITDFFQEIKPVDITKYNAVMYGDTRGESYVIGFHFAQNRKEQDVALYYIDLPDEIGDAGYRARVYDTFKKIGEHWWLGEELDGIPLNCFTADSYYENGAFHN